MHEVFDRLRDFLHGSGKCRKVLAKGNKCKCPSCDLERIMDAFDKRGKLIGLLDEYHGLLGEELNEVCVLATIHGWQSSHIEEGKELRKKIDELREKDL